MTMIDDPTDELPTDEVRTEPAASPTPARGSTFETLAVTAFIFSLFALVISIFAVGLAGRSVSEASDDSGDGGGGGAAPATAVETSEVTMSDFAFDPDDVLVPAGAVLTLVNDGAVTHNLSVDGTASDMVDAGAEGELDLGGVGPGTYEMRCDVPGHAEAGMVGSLTVTAG